MVSVRLAFDIPKIRRLVEDALEETPHDLGAAAVDALSGPSSQWPEKTGRSSAGFGFEVDGRKARITNTEYYAPFVETTTKAGTKTLRRGSNQIIDDVDGELTRRLRVTGRRRRRPRG